MSYAFRYYYDYLGNYKYPMLETEYPYNSSTGDETGKCFYSASKGIKIRVKGSYYLLADESYSLK